MSVEAKTDNSETSSAARSDVTVHRFSEIDGELWEDYVLNHADATLFHTLRWREVIRRTFKHQDCYVIAKRDGGIVGVLPLFRVSSIFFGTTLVSVPFGVYGGMLVNDQEVAKTLVEEARNIAEGCNAKYVELRHLDSPLEGLAATDLYFTFIEDVPADYEGCLARIPRKARAEVRKALKDESLTFGFDDISLKDFHRLFSMNKRKLGSPLFPSSLFWHQKDILADDESILTVRKDGEVIAAVMSFVFKGTIMPYYSGAIPGAERFRASNFMYFRLMEWASAQGLKRFDFGRSRVGTGAYKFKKHQGFAPRQLSYEYLLNTATEVPAMNPSNPKYRMAKKVFANMPLWMAQKVGSWLVKRAPF